MHTANYDMIWQETLDEIEKSNYFSPQDFKNWIKKTTLFKIENSQAYVSYRSLVASTIIQNQIKLFETTLSNIWGADVSILLMDHKDMEKMLPEVVVEQKTNFLLENKFNKAYTFENFVEGGSNAEAYAACMNCCNQTAALFNPLMLYGASGLGKTHLLHSVGNYLNAEKPEAKVIYMYSGDFVSILIEAMKTKNVHGNTVERVKEQLLDCDYFLIDDIQNLKNQASQEVFFSVYNQLIQKGTQIIITSDIHPHDLKEMQSRLISRFSQGLSINIARPEFETSKAILKKKLEGREESCNIQDEVIDYLAIQFSNDVRNLEGKLNRLLFNATLFTPDVIDIPFAEKVFEGEEKISITTPGQITISDIKHSVTDFYGLTNKDLEGKARQKQITNARHICVYLCREMLHKPYATIGQELGNRDHSTISSSYERACKLIKTDKLFSQAIDKIKETLG